MAHDNLVVFGIPLPSRAPIFLGLVAIHVAFALVAVAAGLLAMLSAKGRGRHCRCGKIYFWALAGVFATMSALSYLRWAEDYPLFLLGAVSFSAALLGRWAVRRGRLRLHLASMGCSYIVMLTAFYVDNGKSLPLWQELPQLAFWIIPAALGAPIIVYYLFRLPRLVGPA